ncbi:Protein of uncharacterised function (DUF3170) [Mycobacteroides abscessus subsp. abscessus]|nr:Protein of uncharacterised function (DUF3170) [Mycobacteroides abscessus subsp. abscessus]
MQLVDEQDDVTTGVDLLEHLLEAFLEITAVAAAGHQGPQVQGVQLLVLQCLGHLAVHDRLGQTLDDGGLADTGLADQHRVVLGAAAQHLHDPLDFLLTADDRIELALHGGRGQIAAELVEHQRRRRCAGFSASATGTRFCGLLALVATEQLDDLLTHPSQLGAQLDEHLCGHALALTNQAEQDVLGADVVVAELQRLAQAQLQHLLGTRSERNVPGRRLLTLADDLLDLAAHPFQRDAQRLERLGGDALALMDQTQQDVLGADVVVVEHAGLFLGQHNHPPGAVSESLEHRSPSLPRPAFAQAVHGAAWGSSQTTHPRWH